MLRLTHSQPCVTMIVAEAAKSHTAATTYHWYSVCSSYRSESAKTWGRRGGDFAYREGDNEVEFLNANKSIKANAIGNSRTNYLLILPCVLSTKP